MSGRRPRRSSTSSPGATWPRTFALSLTKGMRVLVVGRLEQRTWETEDGERRSKVEIVADEVGPSLRFATVEVHKLERAAMGEGRRAQATTRPTPTIGPIRAWPMREPLPPRSWRRRWQDDRHLRTGATGPAL